MFFIFSDLAANVLLTVGIRPFSLFWVFCTLALFLLFFSGGCCLFNVVYILNALSLNSSNRPCNAYTSLDCPRRALVWFYCYCSFTNLFLSLLDRMGMLFIAKSSIDWIGVRVGCLRGHPHTTAIPLVLVLLLLRKLQASLALGYFGTWAFWEEKKKRYTRAVRISRMLYTL